MDSTEIILNTYKESQTITETQKRTGYSWQKIAKTLATEGIIANETHRIILNLHDKGMSTEDIAKSTGYAKSTVEAYLHRIRPVYGENQSKNALDIKKYRERKMRNKT